MIYITMSGQTFSAQDAADLVHQLRDSNYTPTDSDADFMKKSASKYLIQMALVVRTNTAASYVDDLIQHGVLKVKSEKDDDQ